MKTLIILSLTILLLVGCNSEKPVESITGAPEKNYDFGTEVAIQKVAVPKITSIVSDAKGYQHSTSLIDYSQYYRAEKTEKIAKANEITVTGTNFGTKTGQLIYTPQPSLFSFIVKSWSDKKIVFYMISLSTAAVPESGSISVKTYDGAKSSSVTLKVAAYIDGSLFGDCVYWSRKRRYEKTSKPLGSTAFSGGNAIDDNYIPTKYDVWFWRGAAPHMAFVESIVLKSGIINSSTIDTFDITLSEMNVVKNKANESYWTTRVVYEKKNQVRKKIEGKLRSYLKSEASEYYR